MKEVNESLNHCIDRLLRSEARIPVATYRLQMHAGFTFADAQAIVPYLRRLGIGDLYLSPIFDARPGSMHGYDVTRHDRLNPELGGDQAFDPLSETIRSAGMGLLLDIVPNHMGVSNDTLWWQDVLENGRASEFAEYFDIDWSPPIATMHDKLLLPILGGQYGEELEAKRIQVAVEDGRPIVRYFDHTMPLAPRTLSLLFEPEELQNLPDLAALFDQLERIPPHDTSAPELAAQRRRQLAGLRPPLHALLRSPHLQPALARAVERINGVEGDPRSFDRLHALLEAQPYRLALWRVSSQEINYRRFFDVNDLVGLRVENPAVFAALHGLIRRLVARGQVTGLRIDHCDGLFNPRQYLIRLQLLALAARCLGEEPQAPLAPSGIELELREVMHGYDWARSQGPLYTVVEKILEPRESLPGEWPVRGTSGYDFVHSVNQLFIQPANEARFNTLYEKVTGSHPDPDEIIYRSKLQVMQTSLSSEVYVLTNLLSRMAAANRRVRDFTRDILESVIRETIACFPVYRTYIDDRGQYTDRDRAFIRYAIVVAKRRNPGIDASAFNFLRDTLLLGARDGQDPAADDTYQQQLYFALKFQQLTGPVMAKGVEDTSFYVYTRFLSSNEVGGSMKAFGLSPENFHAANQERLRHSPGAMLTTSTHDTKRSEDVRARLNVLSEMPAAWALRVRSWQRMNRVHKRILEDNRVAPDANEEYLLYQTIVGAWPHTMQSAGDRAAFLDRMRQYAPKALSEAKINLSWINPDPAYVEAVHAFLGDILTPDARGRETRFVRSLQSVLPQLALFGGLNSLAQTVLKAASPGVPDFYQGTELWNLSLVDPDNRRPVDYALRARLLDEMLRYATAHGGSALCRTLLASFDDGRAKLWTTHRALALRQEQPRLFHHGSYTPLQLAGERSPHPLAAHVVAFERAHQGKSVIAIVPRFAFTLMRGRTALPLTSAHNTPPNPWNGACLVLPADASSSYTNVFTGERIETVSNHRLNLSEVFTHFPVALLRSNP